jgi:hypothetical protein
MTRLILIAAIAALGCAVALRQVDLDRMYERRARIGDA